MLPGFALITNNKGYKKWLNTALDWVQGEWTDVGCKVDGCNLNLFHTMQTMKQPTQFSLNTLDY
jgi:hypothetical protein